MTYQTWLSRGARLVGVTIVALLWMGNCGAPSVPSGGTPDPSVVPNPAGGAGDDPEKPLFPEDGDPLVALLPIEPDELIVQTQPGADPDDLIATYARTCATVIESLPQINMVVLGVSPAALESSAAGLASSPLVAAVQKNYNFPPTRLPNDPEFAAQTYLDTVGLPAAWDVSTGSQDIIIAILDSGISAGHPDLAGKVLAGWNAFDDDGDIADVSGHGTAVAGIAAAMSNNAEGLAGVSWGSLVLPVRVTNESGQASSRSIAAGLVWASDHGAKVANVSFAPLASDRIVHRAAAYFRNSGGLVFISAGNDGQASDAEGTTDAIYVGALDQQNARALFSTTGPFVDLTLPGTAITVPTREGGYSVGDGTSFASPIGAGIAALIWAVRPELRPATVEEILYAAASDLGPSGKDDAYGWGMVDAGRALASARGIVEADDRTPPTGEIVWPKSGEEISGVVVVEVDAFDDTDLADVVLFVDGQPFATDSYPPYAFSFDTGELMEGVHTVNIGTTDRAGNSRGSDEVPVVVVASNDDGGEAEEIVCDPQAPAVVFNFPVNGSVVSSRVAIQVTVTDNLGVAQIEWLLDGGRVQAKAVSGTRVTDTFLWEAESAAVGGHTLTVKASDASGNITTATLELVKR